MLNRPAYNLLNLIHSPHWNSSKSGWKLLPMAQDVEAVQKKTTRRINASSQCHINVVIQIVIYVTQPCVVGWPCFWHTSNIYSLAYRYGNKIIFQVILLPFLLRVCFWIVTSFCTPSQVPLICTKTYKKRKIER